MRIFIFRDGDCENIHMPKARFTVFDIFRDGSQIGKIGIFLLSSFQLFVLNRVNI